MKKVVIFVTNISESLVGKEIAGYVLKKTYRGSDDKEDYLNKHSKAWEFADKLFAFSRYSIDNQPDEFLHSDENGFYYLYFQRIFEEEKEDEFFRAINFISALTIYIQSSVSFAHPYFFSDSHGNCIMRSHENNYYAFNEWRKMDMKEKEIVEFETFFSLYQGMEINKDVVQRMIDIWMTSRRIPSFMIKFILHVTILEMFIDGNAELSYRLSRGVAVFLGKTKEESTLVFNNMKSLYNARSKFLHEGKENIKDENEINAQNYARELIRKLINMSSGEKKKTLTKIRNDVTECGFGEF